MMCKNIKLIVNSLINSKSVNLHPEIKIAMRKVERYTPKNKIRIVTITLNISEKLIKKSHKFLENLKQRNFFNEKK